MTRHKLQQFPWGFRLYDSDTEQPADGEIARYNVNMEEAEMIDQGATIEIRDGEPVVYFEGEIV